MKPGIIVRIDGVSGVVGAAPPDEGGEEVEESREGRHWDLFDV